MDNFIALLFTLNVLLLFIHVRNILKQVFHHIYLKNSALRQ